MRSAEIVPGAQIVVQVARAAGKFDRTAYGNVATGRCANIVVAGDARGKRDLAQAIDRAMTAVSASGTRVKGRPLEDAGFADPKCQKLLVLVGDDTTPVALPSFASRWKTSGDYSVLPVLPEKARTSFTRLMPAAFHAKNAAYWQKSIDEVVPAVLSSAAITVDVPRVFISYRQKESAGLAVQLFDALSHRGFDVFLDHYRVPAAANFQERLTQELGDKSMLVVLESSGILDSEWTTYEINTAKACELTLVAVHLPGGPKVDAIDDAARKEAFKGKPFTPEAKLSGAQLKKLVDWIAQQHDTGVLRRRGALQSAIRHELTLRGVRNVHIDGAGVMHVKVKGKEYLIWPSVRSPELSDFHVTHQAMSQVHHGAVIGLARLFAWSTRQRLDWLSGVCNVAMVDRGQIGVTAEAIAKGRSLP